jgi:ABC-type branched-subunit amino acid transport system substrate-binding protein
LVSACAPGPPPPVEEKVVEIGNLALFSGGGAIAEAPFQNALFDYVRYFNAEKGIPGVTIKVVWIDTGTDTGRFISGYHRLVDRGVPTIFSNLNAPLEALKPQFERDQIPVITAGASATMIYPPGWIYCIWVTGAEAVTPVLDYFMQNWDEERPPRLQFLIIAVAWGYEAAEQGAKYAESIGFEALPLEISPHVTLDATTQLLRIREHEVDLVYIQHIISGAGPIMRDVERLGLQDEMQFSGTEWILGEPLINMSPVATEGFLVARATPWLDETEIPGIGTMTDIQLKYRGEVGKAPEYTTGWVYGTIICEAVKRALEEVGYENLDGPAVKRALESIKDFDVGGMAKFTFGPEDRKGADNYAVYQVQGGKIVRVTDWREVPMLMP